MSAPRRAWLVGAAVLVGILLATFSPVASSAPRGGLDLTPRVYLPYVARQCLDAIRFTSVPAYGSFDDLQGQVTCVEPSAYRVAVYIYVSGWWTKPTWDAPLTPIAADGSWTCDITTGGADQFATRITAFLIPNGYSPPLLAGEQQLPGELYANAEAYVTTSRGFRTLWFSGRTWTVKSSVAPVGPGPNYFSDRPEDVWVDANGRLHLKIVSRDGHWYCTEIVSEESLGYGTYTFTLASRVDLLDKNVILGLFTWDTYAPQYNYREIDVEISRWGDDDNDNAQFVIQPWGRPGNLYRFNAILQGDYSTHRFEWRADRVQFGSYQGYASSGAEIASWLYTGPDVPPAGGENVRINLWLMNGIPPSDGQEVEVIVEAFGFTP